MTLLRNILNGTVTSNFILIEDSLQHDGLPFLFSLVSNLRERCEQVHLLCTDCSTELFVKKFTITLQEKTTWHRIYEDPLNWNSSSRRGPCFATDLNEYLCSCESYKGMKDGSLAVVVIDSVSPLLMERDLGPTCRTLMKLRKRAGNSGNTTNLIVCRIHTDVHDDQVTKTFERLASTILKMDPTDPRRINVTHKYESGKLAKEATIYTLSNDKLEITLSSKTLPPHPRIKPSTEEVEQLAPKLTFKVSLEDGERQERAKLVLPYERVAETSSNSGGRGQIFYEPDAADDFDEEDPDDDLDV